MYVIPPGGEPPHRISTVLLVGLLPLYEWPKATTRSLKREHPVAGMVQHPIDYFRDIVYHKLKDAWGEEVGG